jgi:preprotein translocase subunit SecE
LSEKKVKKSIIKLMKLVKYVKASYEELVHKVSWTPMKELQSLAVTVMVASLVIAAVVLAMDVTFESIMKAIYSILAH